GHNIWEVRQVAKVAKEMKVSTQMGNHGHSNNALREVQEWIADGAIGKVREVHAYSVYGGWVNHKGRPTNTPPVPASLNWDLWLGVRPERPYSPEYAPYNWRGWWPFGNGCLGDLGAHHTDHAVTSLKLTSPRTVVAEPIPADSEVVPDKAHYTWEFDARGDMRPV